MSVSMNMHQMHQNPKYFFSPADAYFSKTAISAGGIIKTGAGSIIRVIAIWVNACNKRDKNKL